MTDEIKNLVGSLNSVMDKTEDKIGDLERKSPGYKAQVQRDKISDKSQETGKTDQNLPNRSFNRKWIFKKTKGGFSELKKTGVFLLKQSTECQEGFMN